MGSPVVGFTPTNQFSSILSLCSHVDTAEKLARSFALDVRLGVSDVQWILGVTSHNVQFLSPDWSFIKFGED
jgi:hypothetical protein